LQRRLGRHLRLQQAALREGQGRSHITLDEYPAHPAYRSIPVTIYLSEGLAHREVQRALAGLLAEVDFKIVDFLEPLKGSWFRFLAARTKDAITSSELTDRLHKVERGIELHLLHKRQAEIDSLQGDAVAKLLSALETTPSALIQIGSVLIVKVDGVPAVRNLTQQELIHLQRNPGLLMSPATIFEALQEAVPQIPALVDQES
jgi:hypothetical protein